MKVMRERRFLVALAMVSAIVTGSAGTSSAFIGDDGFSHTQPGAELIMPFDATEGKATFLLVSNINGTSPSGGAQISTHWTFWSETCDELANFSICLTLNDTVVVDPTNARAQGPNNETAGPIINLTGKRGLVTVTAYETNSVCGDYSQTGQVLVDNAIVGTFTFADTEVSYAFGNDAFALGLNFEGTAVELPESAFVDAYNLQVFDPTSVEASVVVLSHLREQAVGQVEPNPAAIRFATTFYDINEIPTSLPDQTAGCVKFTTISSEGTTTGLIPPTVDVTTSGVIRLDPISGFGPNDYLYGIVGQAVGPFGASSSAKVTIGEPSASRAFVDAPATLLD
jgi:hypothetical protein